MCESEKSVDIIEIFADGSSEGNSTGCGGWGAIIRKDGWDEEISGAFHKATNNQMELMAVIKALKCLRDKRYTIVICTDSQYVKNGITEWIKRWKINGWKTADKEPVKNKDLWVQLDELVQQHDITWKWIKGHKGHFENERCDKLAAMARIKAQRKRDYVS
jgi:ribonuclease HI